MHFKLIRALYSAEAGGAAGGESGQAAGGQGGPSVLGGQTGAGGGQSGGGQGGGGQGGQGGTGAGEPPPVSWDASLDPNYRTLVQAKGWKSPADVLRDYSQLEGTLGQNKVAVPGKDAKPEDWDGVYNALGRPESPDKYDLGDFKPPEGLPWDGEAQKAMLAEMHAAGLNSTQAQRLLKKYGEMQGGSYQAMQGNAAAFVEQATQQLRKDWGNAYDANLELANRAVKRAFGDELDSVKQLRMADGTFMLDNPAIAKAFARVGGAWSEDSDLPGGRSGGGSAAIRTPDQAKAEISRIRSEAASDPKHPYVNRQHPEFKALQGRMNELYVLANGGKQGTS
jgi:hypothetical protein